MVWVLIALWTARVNGYFYNRRFLSTCSDSSETTLYKTICLFRFAVQNAAQMKWSLIFSYYR